jgi:16S rRNA (cytidine1402-2'-O)-methyltransferase
LSAGNLYLIPVPISGGTLADQVLTQQALDVTRRLDRFVVENAKQARHWLKAMRHPKPLQELHLMEIGGRAASSTVAEALDWLRQGVAVGLMSDAGAPGVADPGAELTRAAHQEGICVIPLVGPSSILLALMASGLNGQHFCFNGYLPVEKSQRARRIAELEQLSRAQNQTQIFIETPYRNAALFGALLHVCGADTWLCIACDLTGQTQSVRTQSIGQWRRETVTLDDRPTVFLLLA